MAWSVEQALAHGRAQLGEASESPVLDVEVLLSHVLRQGRSYLRAHPERELTQDQQLRFASLVQRRAAGEPVAYLTGRREFWSLELLVTPDTLIPRPETELLVEQALRRLPNDRPCRAADLGTGSGAIALAIAAERPQCHVLAVERSLAALAVARKNRDALGLRNVHLCCGDWCTALAQQRFDLIAANPPYVAEADPHLRQGDLRFEPRAALASGPTGLLDIERIVEQALKCLRRGGWLLLEHGFDQGESVRTLLQQAGYEAICTHRDLAGRDRVSAGRKPQ